MANKVEIGIAKQTVSASSLCTGDIVKICKAEAYDEAENCVCIRTDENHLVDLSDGVEWERDTFRNWLVERLSAGTLISLTVKD